MFSLCRHVIAHFAIWWLFPMCPWLIRWCLNSFWLGKWYRVVTIPPLFQIQLSQKSHCERGFCLPNHRECRRTNKNQQVSNSQQILHSQVKLSFRRSVLQILLCSMDYYIGWCLLNTIVTDFVVIYCFRSWVWLSQRVNWPNLSSRGSSAVKYLARLPPSLSLLCEYSFVWVHTTPVHSE